MVRPERFELEAFCGRESAAEILSAVEGSEAYGAPGEIRTPPTYFSGGLAARGIVIQPPLPSHEKIFPVYRNLQWQPGLERLKPNIGGEEIA